MPSGSMKRNKRLSSLTLTHEELAIQEAVTAYLRPKHMPETRLAKTRQTLPEGYQFGDRSRFIAYLRENFASGRYQSTPQGLADAVDDAAGRAAFEDFKTMQ